MRGVDKRIFELARPFLSTRENGLHVQVAYRFAVRLLAEIEADEEVVLPAVLLHDVGWIKIPEELHLTAFGPRPHDTTLNRVHEVEGAKLAQEILGQIDYDKSKTKEIGVIIEGHDSRREALSPNDQIVKDADKLWRFSREGFYVEAERFHISYEEFRAWLGQQIEDWFLSEVAKRMAGKELEQRRRELQTKSRG